MCINVLIARYIKLMSLYRIAYFTQAKYFCSDIREDLPFATFKARNKVTVCPWQLAARAPAVLCGALKMSVLIKLQRAGLGCGREGGRRLRPCPAPAWPKLRCPAAGGRARTAGQEAAGQS